MIGIRECEQCGKEYIATGNSQRFCCEPCRRQWWKENPPVVEKKVTPEKPKKTKSLHEICKEARKAGMTYGKYILYLEKGIKV